MKFLKALALGIALGSVAAPAVWAQPITQVYSFTNGFADGGVIADGDITGWSDTRVIEDWLGDFSISNVKVTLTISGGFNGDLYAYLANENGLAVLLNRVGRTDSSPFGYADAGLAVTLDDNAASDIHLYGGNGGNQLAGLFQPDGRNVNPAVVTDASERTAPLSLFNGSSPNGPWTLFLADLSVGGESLLEGWQLEVTGVPVPEPAALALGVMGLATVFILRRQRRG